MVGAAVLAYQNLSTTGGTNPYPTTIPSLSVTQQLTLGGGVALHRNAITDASYTLLSTDNFVSVSTTNLAVALSLPSATSVPAGTWFIVKDRSGNASTKAITITANGTNTIDATSTYIIGANWDFVRMMSDGASNWETF